jgi:hypothetical protein
MCILTIIIAASVALALPEERLHDRVMPVGWSFAGQAFPRFSPAGLIAYDRDFQTVRLFRGGQVGSSYSVVLPGATAQVIRDVTRSADGTAVVLAGGQNQLGDLVSVIVWLAGDGRLIRMVRTEPFAAFTARFTKNGTLWVLGRVPDEKFEDKPGHKILRMYDPQGRLFAERIEVETFGVSNPAAYARLVSCGDRTGIWMESTREWVELSPDGTMTGRWQLPRLPQALGVECVQQRLYVTVEGPDSARQLELTKLGSKLDATDVTDRLAAGKSAVVVGSEGDSLVFYTRPPTALAWIRPKP